MHALGEPFYTLWAPRATKYFQGIQEAKITKIHCWILKNKIKSHCVALAGLELMTWAISPGFASIFVCFWDRDSCSSGYMNSWSFCLYFQSTMITAMATMTHFLCIPKWCAYMASYWFLDVIYIILFTSNHHKLGFFFSLFFPCQTQSFVCAT